jgi:hypothetical protein
MNDRTRLRLILTGAGAIAAVAVGIALWQRQPAPAPVAMTPAEPAAAPASAPGIKHPIEAVASAAPAPAGPPDVAQALTDLLGRKAALTYLQLDDFPRRFVATVDNLGRAHAAASLWPVNPAPERFLVEAQGERRVISADNGLRYTPLVLLAETVDIGQAVDLYVRLYPQFQKAYEDLGYPGLYFNDRLVAVIDHLLATPAVSEPIEVRLTEVKGPVPSERPWVRYEFADPALEALSSGQKIMLRVGPINERRLKARLAEVRRAITRRSDARQ